MITSLTGKDTIKINGRILSEFCDGDTAAVEVPTDLVTVKTGKNGNSIYAFNYSGRQVNMTLRLLRGGADDSFMLNLMNLFINDPASFALMTGEFTKNIGDGAGNVKSDTYTLSGGAFKKMVEVKENVDGDVEQALAVYHLVFSNAPRAIG